MNWSQLLESMDNNEFQSIQDAMEMETIRREGGLYLTKEEEQMGKVQAVLAVQRRTGFSLMLSKAYIEAVLSKKGEATK